MNRWMAGNADGRVLGGVLMDAWCLEGTDLLPRMTIWIRDDLRPQRLDRTADPGSLKIYRFWSARWRPGINVQVKSTINKSRRNMRWLASDSYFGVAIQGSHWMHTVRPDILFSLPRIKDRAYRDDNSFDSQLDSALWWVKGG